MIKYSSFSNEVGKFDGQSGLTGENKRRVEKYHFPKETPLVMRLTFETGASAYKVSLGGQVSVAEQANPPTPSAAVPSSEVLRLPKSGVLTIKMRDGSVRTINLSEIQAARIETQSPQK